ncbi:MAG TPA: DUF4340 domain-containing protein [Candidatus Aquilonibacter sp.]|nr:DUF4340 domain-containing protein [Candidatus Aquilonibacter sp.]
MIKKSTLIVLLCAVVAGASFYFFDWKRSQNEKPPVDMSKPAFSVDASNIRSFTISHPGQSGDVPVHFEKRNGEWWITQPIDTRADQPTAEGIIDELSEDRISQTEPGAEDRRKAYGLDPAQASVEFDLANGAKHTLLIGNKDFSGDSLYTVADGGQSVALLPAAIFDTATKPFEQLRDRSVVHLDSATLQRIEIRDSNGDMVVATGKSGDWAIDSPAAQKGKKAESWKVIDPFTGLTATDVIDKPPANLAALVANPAIRVVFTSADGKQVTLRISKPSGDFFYAQSSDSPALYKLAKPGFDSLNLKPADVVPSDAATVNP